MAVSEDTTAIVAAHLTMAWATRMGQAAPDERGAVGTRLLAVYEAFRDDLERVSKERQAAGTDAWIASLKDN